MGNAHFSLATRGQQGGQRVVFRPAWPSVHFESNYITNNVDDTACISLCLWMARIHIHRHRQRNLGTLTQTNIRGCVWSLLKRQQHVAL